MLIFLPLYVFHFVNNFMSYVNILSKGLYFIRLKGISRYFKFYIRRCHVRASLKSISVCNKLLVANHNTVVTFFTSKFHLRKSFALWSIFRYETMQKSQSLKIEYSSTIDTNGRAINVRMNSLFKCHC